MKRFTEQEDAFIRENYLKLTSEQIGKELSRNLGSIYGRIGRLGLVVPEEIKQQRKIDGLNYGWTNGPRFKKGSIPHNKGKKWSEFMPKESQLRSSQTFFKKGNVPHNTKADGVISIRADKSGKKYQHVRVSQGKWKLLHRVVFEAHYGKLNSGDVIRFIDGNTLNCNINNLFATDRHGNMALNTIHRYPPEVKKAIRALKKLNKTIKSYENE